MNGQDSPARTDPLQLHEHVKELLTATTDLLTQWRGASPPNWQSVHDAFERFHRYGQIVADELTDIDPHFGLNPTGVVVADHVFGSWHEATARLLVGAWSGLEVWIGCEPDTSDTYFIPPWVLDWTMATLGLTDDTTKYPSLCRDRGAIWDRMISVAEYLGLAPRPVKLDDTLKRANHHGSDRAWRAMVNISLLDRTALGHLETELRVVSRLQDRSGGSWLGPLSVGEWKKATRLPAKRLRTLMRTWKADGKAQEHTRESWSIHSSVLSATQRAATAAILVPTRGNSRQLMP